MPQAGFEEFTPSHNFKVLSDSAAHNMGAVYADIYARKKDKEFKDNAIENSKIYEGERDVITMTSGHNSPVKFMGGIVGAALGLGAGGSKAGGLFGAIQGLINKKKNKKSATMAHEAMHKRLEKKLGDLTGDTGIVDEMAEGQIANQQEEASADMSGVLAPETPSQLTTSGLSDTGVNVGPLPGFVDPATQGIQALINNQLT